jgi:hypothetical protein
VTSRLVPLIALLAGCAGHPSPEPFPHRFSQSLIDVPPLLDNSDGDGRSIARPPRAVTRCRSLVGRTLDAADAAMRLLRACLGPTMTGALAKAGQPFAALEPRRSEPLLLDVALFRGTRPEAGEGITDAGVVVAVTGSRVEFVYVRAATGRVALGALNMSQPHRRRLGRSARVENSYLRVIRPTDGPATRYLAGELLAGFATLPSSARSDELTLVQRP